MWLKKNDLSEYKSKSGQKSKKSCIGSYKPL